MKESPKLETFCFVSCDIVGHGRLGDMFEQQRRIYHLNEIVQRALRTCERAVWASGGDGGHVAFPLMNNPRRAARRAIKLMRRLFKWGHHGEVSLRITGHVGPALRTTGADGRTQLVGDGINVCGSVVDFGDPSAIVVTDPLRELVIQEGVSGVTFKDERTVYLKHFSSARLFLLDIEGAVHSKWGVPTKSEHQLLREAIDKRLAWQVIYHAKRLLQSNTSDKIARDALSLVATDMAGELVAEDNQGRPTQPNRFLSEMDPTSFSDFSLNSELVERENGERLCQADDDGDTMFLVLMGKVGVVVASTEPSAIDGHREAPLDLSFGPGHMVGELAFLLRRSRTAALQAIGRTAVLAINYNKLEQALSLEDEPPEDVRREIMRYFQDRTLEYLCNHTPYLIGPDKSGPLSALRQPWRWMRGRRTEVFQLDAAKHDVICANDPRFSSTGLYALVGGQLERGEYAVLSEHRDQLSKSLQVVDGRRPQILWVDMPDSLVHTMPTYRIKSEHAVVMRISFNAFRDKHLIDQTVLALKRELMQHLLFDVFLAYDNRNRDLALAWAKQLRDEGLSVYMNEPVAGAYFKREIVAAMLSSAVLAPLVTSDVSPKTNGRGKQRGAGTTWVHREVELRRALCVGGVANIVPIQIRDANVENVADGFAAIKVASERDLEAPVRELVERVRKIKSSSDPIPFARKRAKLPDKFVDRHP